MITTRITKSLINYLSIILSQKIFSIINFKQILNLKLVTHYFYEPKSSCLEIKKRPMGGDISPIIHPACARHCLTGCVPHLIEKFSYLHIKPFATCSILWNQSKTNVLPLIRLVKSFTSGKFWEIIKKTTIFYQLIYYPHNNSMILFIQYENS